MAKKKTVKKSSGKAASFEENLAELDRIVAELEGGELGLSDALARYEQGVNSLHACQKQLNEAERKIELLSGVDANGNPITEPFDDEAGETLAEKGAARSRRRSNKRTSGRVANKADMDDRGRLF